MPFRGPREGCSRGFLAARSLYLSFCFYTAGRNEDLNEKITVRFTIIQNNCQRRNNANRTQEMAPLPVADASSSLVDVAKRGNWASKNPGPILVFCIVFIVGLGVVLLFLYRYIMSRKAAKQAYEVE